MQSRRQRKQALLHARLRKKHASLRRRETKKTSVSLPSRLRKMLERLQKKRSRRHVSPLRELRRQSSLQEKPKKKHASQPSRLKKAQGSQLRRLKRRQDSRPHSRLKLRRMPQNPLPLLLPPLRLPLRSRLRHPPRSYLPLLALPVMLLLPSQLHSSRKTSSRLSNPLQLINH